MLNVPVMTSQQVPCNDIVADKAEEPQIILELNLTLGPKPSNSKVEHESAKLELSSSESSKASHPMALKPLDEMHVEKVKMREYSCKYCNKKFLSSQAFGGHQNGHKRERAMEKLENTMTMDPFRYMGSEFHPYPGMAALPLRASFNRSFGAAMQQPPLSHEPHYHRYMQSMVHGSYYPPSMPLMIPESYFPQSRVGSLGHGYQGMSTPTIRNYWTTSNGYQQPGRAFFDAGPNSGVSGGLSALKIPEFAANGAGAGAGAGAVVVNHGLKVSDSENRQHGDTGLDLSLNL